jgi:Fe-S cluster biogenesis protein NfuA/nitrite reductase/ring-hydroxylating ferredoxin subunit
LAGATGDVGDRVEELLDRLRAESGPAAAATGEELVRLLVGYYGDGLTRIVEIGGPEATHALAADPLVESQLILHGLHPLELSERVEAALDRVRPYLGSHAGGVAFLGVDADGVAQLRLDGNCHGCPSSTVTVRTAIEEALLSAAPELSGVQVEGQVEQTRPLLQIGLRPGADNAAPRASGAAPSVWLHPSARELPADGRAAAVHLDGQQVLMARRGETLYAYADICPACGSGLAGGELAGDLLACPACAARFDIRLAGKAVDGSGRHLDPLPLLDDVSGIRVAVHAGAT